MMVRSMKSMPSEPFPLPPARNSTTSFSSSTATCSDSMARFAETAKSSRNWNRCSAVPAGTSSRSCGAGQWDHLLAADRDGALGQLDEQHSRWRLPDLQSRETVLSSASTSSGAIPAPQNSSRVGPTTKSGVLQRGGHDYRKMYAAYKAAQKVKGQPTVILAKTIKGWTLGSHFEARNSTHQMKKLTVEDLKEFRDRLHIPIPDSQLDEYLPPYYNPGMENEAIQYMFETPAQTRWLPAKPPAKGQAAAATCGFDLRIRDAWIGQSAGRYHHGVRSTVEGLDQGRGHGRALRADHPR